MKGLEALKAGLDASGEKIVSYVAKTRDRII